MLMYNDTIQIYKIVQFFPKIQIYNLVQIISDGVYKNIYKYINILQFYYHNMRSYTLNRKL